MSTAVAVTSSHATSVRGVMIERAVRSASRRTPSIISRSFGMNTPARVPSAMSNRTSSSVTVRSRPPDAPSRRSSPSVE